MPSFDIACEVDLHELDNALNQARKEIATRFDFKNAQAEILLEKSLIKLAAVDAFKLQALAEIVQGKMARRNISLKNIALIPAQISPTGHASQEIKLKQGLDPETAKAIQQHIRHTKLKVTSQIQDAQIRVTGKSRDDLQAVITSVRTADFGVALTFKNFRD